MNAALHIELTAPQTVNGKRVAYQSLWLLVRLYYARQHEAAAPPVRLVELRRQFTDARTLRMFISRAFRDFNAWSVRVGWGEDAQADPRFLNPAGRSQGPFWLPEEEAEQLQCTVDGKPATQAELLRFLDVKRNADAVAPAPAAMPLDYWLALAGAQQQLREGRLLAALGDAGPGAQAGALAGFRQAGSAAANRLQHALAALGEAQVWRRLDDIQAARKTLGRLRAMLKQGGADEGGFLDAMEQILSAWCAYSERDLDLTHALLTAMRQTEPRASVVRHHPRIRFEWNNLMALVQRTEALAPGERAGRQQAAAGALACFAAALDAAFEFGSFDAAQQVAANAGMATWLFAKEGLGPFKDAAAAQPDAVRWLVLSEWLCQCAGAAGQSVWNAIYLMRIARGTCGAGERPALAAFRGLAPLDTAALAQPGLPIDLLRAERWVEVAARLLGHQRAQRYGVLQRCGLRLEHAWYAAHAGELAAAQASVAVLLEDLARLPTSDKAYFQSELRCLPAEVLPA